MTSDSEPDHSAPAPHEVRVPIMRQLDSYDITPDHVRGAQYANQVLGTSFGKGDAVRVAYIDHVEPAFFERVERERDLDADGDELYGEFKRDPDVICVADLEDLPDEFHLVADTTGGER
jgi:DNA polymerase I